MREATEFNTVKHTPKNESGVTNRFFFAKLNIVFTKKFGVHTKVAGAGNEGTTGTSGSLFKEHGDSLAFVVFIGNSGELIIFELFCGFKH